MEFILANGEPITAHKSIDERTGEVNAWDKKDLMKQINTLLTASAKGEIKKKDEIKTRRETLLSAYSKGGDAWKILGEVVGDEINETLEKEGFIRRVLLSKEAAQGDVIRIRVKKRDVVAYLLNSASSVTPVRPTNNYVYPDEVYVAGEVLIEEKEIAQATGDLLGEKYEEALEATLVQEDRYLRQLAETVVASGPNNIVYFSTFTPSVLGQVIEPITGYNLPVANIILASNLVKDILSNADWSNYFDPASKYEIILTGQIGSIWGINLITDAYRQPNLKVLNQNEVFAFTSPENLGEVITRGPVSVNPIDGYQQGRPERGWYFFELMAAGIVNPYGVVKAQTA